MLLRLAQNPGLFGRFSVFSEEDSDLAFLCWIWAAPK
jgi:hypothetical protein